jgi:iron complex transport system permease protein
MRRRRRATIVLAGLGLALFGGILLACALGAVSIPPLDIIRMTLDRAPFLDFEPTWELTDETIIFEIRLVRVVAGALVGAALATAGVLFQGLLRNPMADPYIIGTSAGAALGATLAMLVPVGIAFAGFGLVTVGAFCGALAAVLLVYNLASVGGRTPVVTMLLAGFVVSAMLVAVMSLLITVNDTLQVKLHSIFSFLMGSLSVSGWIQIAAVAPLVVGGILVSRFFAFHLNAFSLGEEGAAFVGVNVEREKVLILALGSLLTACAVSLSGVVGFVGLVVPHAMRLALGPDHRLLLPASALGGAAFLVVADTVARAVLAPTEIPVGIFTALVGAPVFIYLLRRTRREYAF